MLGEQPWELVIEELTTARAPFRDHTSFDSAVSAARAEFGRFVDAAAPSRAPTVDPVGFVTRPAVLMSSTG